MWEKNENNQRINFFVQSEEQFIMRQDIWILNTNKWKSLLCLLVFVKRLLFYCFNSIVLIDIVLTVIEPVEGLQCDPYRTHKIKKQDISRFWCSGLNIFISSFVWIIYDNMSMLFNYTNEGLHYSYLLRYVLDFTGYLASPNDALKTLELKNFLLRQNF